MENHSDSNLWQIYKTSGCLERLKIIEQSIRIELIILVERPQAD